MTSNAASHIAVRALFLRDSSSDTDDYARYFMGPSRVCQDAIP
jgi:hypothetical protein